MPSLHELQAAFAAAVQSGDNGFLPMVVAGGPPQAERLAVYRNNARHNFREALRAVYPVVEMLVGSEFFAACADIHAAAHPSTSGDIHGYGGRFGDSLAGFAPAAGLPYLPDMARLEWAMHEVFHAPDDEVLNLEGLLDADIGSLRFRLNRSCRLLRSPYPVDRLWALHQPGVSWDDGFDLFSGGVSMLVRRVDYEVAVERLGEPDFTMLSELASGEKLDTAFETALRWDEGFDLGAFLVRYVSCLVRA